MKLAPALSAVFLAAAAATANDTLTYSVHCAYSPTGFSQIYYQETDPYLSNEFEIGGRLQPAARVSVDLAAGAVHVTGYESESASNTVRRPSVYSSMLRAGVMYDLFKGDRSKIGAIAQAGFNYEKSYAYNPATSARSSFHLLSPFGFIGFEPSVEITENFVFFTRFGLKARYNPATQAYEPGANGDGTIDYFLVKKANSNVTTAIEGFCIGIRYQFTSRYFE